MFPMKKEEMTQNSVPNKCHQAEKKKKNKEQNNVYNIPPMRQCWLVAAHRTGSHSQGCHGTSLLCLVFAQGRHQPLMAPAPDELAAGDEFN